MNKTIFSILIINILFVMSAGAQQKEGNPAENLPPYIKRITQFGERADWSHDGKFMTCQMARSGDLAGVGYKFSITILIIYF